MTNVIPLPTPQTRPEHFANCDATAIGRRVQWLADHNGVAARFALEDILSGLEEHRHCTSCFRIQRAQIEADLEARRKAQAAGHDRSDEIVALEARLIVFREAMGR